MDCFKVLLHDFVITCLIVLADMQWHNALHMH